MIALDSSVMVTGVVRTDERHAKALRAIRGAFDSPEGMLVPVHALVETYAVITRMPAPHRATPAEAVKALRDTFGVARLAPLSARSVWMLLDGLAEASFGAGRGLSDIVYVRVGSGTGAAVAGIVFAAALSAHQVQAAEHAGAHVPAVVHAVRLTFLAVAATFALVIALVLRGGKKKRPEV